MRRLLCLGVLAALACKGTEPATTGGVRVTAATTGSDLDPDGYVVTLLGDTATGASGHSQQPIAVNGTVTFSSLEPGSYWLTLSGAIANCPVGGDNPRVAAVTVGHTAEIAFQVVCQQRVDLSGVWNYTDQIGTPLACNDTGSLVFVSRGDGFGGTNDLVGTCDAVNGSFDYAFSDSVSGGPVYSVSGAVSVAFSTGGCSYAAQVSGAPPDHLMNGSVSCSFGNGTWGAVRGEGAIGSVAVAPATRSVVAGGTAQLRAVMLDASGGRRVGPVVTWTSDAPTVATVDTGGLVTGLTPGSATITATAQSHSGTAAVGVAVVTFAAVQPGAYHSCGLTTDSAAYCWGHGAYGQIGDGAKASPVAPEAVAANLHFASISVGAGHSCGLTATGKAYCWGLDLFNELGAGIPGPQLCGMEAAPCSTAPIAVAGGQSFASLAAGWTLTCALDAGGAAYCWGDNTYGGLGNPPVTSTRTPVAVTGGHTFVSIGAGVVFACGLAADSTAYCWGNNSAGQLGIGPGSPAVCGGEPCSTTPAPVYGGLKFTTLSVGYWHVCGLTADSTAYCWGDNDGGQLGTTTPETCPPSAFGSAIGCSTVPLPVQTALHFAKVSAGSFHSCGVVATGGGYCWGAGVYGQLGDGTGSSSLSPVRVAGGLSFAAASAFGRWHSCGLTTGGFAYCWGLNDWGQLGMGPGAPGVCGGQGDLCSLTPVLVLGQAGAPGGAPPRVVRLLRGTTRSTGLRLSPRFSSPSRSGRP